VSDGLRGFYMQYFDRMAAKREAAVERRRREVAQLLVDVGKSLHAFDHGKHVPFEGVPQYLSKTVDQTMKEAEAAFADADYDRAEHLARVVAALVKREAPIFAADPKRWIEKWRGVPQ
jgi:hypothetical protein